MPISPIGIALERPGLYRGVTSVAQMGEILTTQWPEDQQGDAWKAALSACLRALQEQTNPEAARAAFIMAAKDAGISVRLSG
jgi:hypothetical protein